jgi:metallo-beta-lactamase class B
MRSGGVAQDDPQYGDIRGLTPIQHVRTLQPGETVRLGPLALTPHPTPGHTAGGTSWTWTSCEAAECEHMVYVDSVTAVSRPRYKFTDHPALIGDFQSDFAWLDTVPCDILITPHPDASNLFERQKSGKLIDPSACKVFAEHARESLTERLSKEK